MSETKIAVACYRLAMYSPGALCAAVLGRNTQAGCSVAPADAHFDALGRYVLSLRRLLATPASRRTALAAGRDCPSNRLWTQVPDGRTI